MDALKTEEYKGYTISIYPDENAESPRTFESNLGVMICFHGRYNLGDKQEHTSGEFNSWEELANHLRDEHDARIILPLYLYDHSGLRMKVGSFAGLLPQGHAEFDSGQVGFIYTTSKAIFDAFMPERGGRFRPKLTAKLLQRAKEALEVEVKVYDQFLSGDVYGYVVTKKVTCDKCGHEEDEQEESCWGFYGGGEVTTEAKRIVDSLVKRKAAEKKKG